MIAIIRAIEGTSLRATPKPATATAANSIATDCAEENLSRLNTNPKDTATKGKSSRIKGLGNQQSLKKIWEILKNKGLAK